ncbi:MAG: beta-propeller domain-containing protein, partial [Ruminococcus sp.]|nr:beta-propeller domain-containing protein [Ruminococcus sp.]
TEMISAVTELNDSNFREFYVNGDRLVVLSEVYYSDSSTEASVYDISDRSKPKLLDSFSQSGNYVSSRMIGGTLYLVSDYYAYNDDDMPETRSKNATPDEVPVNCTYSVETPADSRFLVVSSVDTQNGAKALSTKSILGSADDVYCNQDYLYVNATEYETQDYNRVINSFASYYTPTNVRTQIVKFSLNDNLDAVASCYVKGEINNQYSLDEYNGNLRVATTSINEKNSFEVNNLYVLDSELNQIGSVEGFAKDESIKAVRYMGDTAYVITYEETDPLFVIDLSTPSDPQILGEVKISGFSTMLVPIDENTVLGIGYNTDNVYYTNMEVQDGIKIVTFDVSDKTNPKVLDTKVFKGYYSEVQNNPKALLVNTERNDFTIPFSCYGDGYSNYDSYSGVINFRISDGKIDIVDQYRSDVFVSSENGSAEVSRCVYVGNTIYMLGNVWEYDYYIKNNTDDVYRTSIDWVDYK